MQVVAPNLRIELPVIDLRAFTLEEREKEAHRIVAGEAQTPFDLQVWPLLRTKVLQLGDCEYIHLLVIHHIICDFWSLNVLFEELSIIYDAYCRGEDSPLPDLQVQYADYAEWERDYLQGPKGISQLAYWKQQLSELPTLQLPTDWPRPALPSYVGRPHYFTLPASLYRGS